MPSMLSDHNGTKLGINDSKIIQENLKYLEIKPHTSK